MKLNVLSVLLQTSTDLKTHKNVLESCNLARNKPANTMTHFASAIIGRNEMGTQACHSNMNGDEWNALLHPYEESTFLGARSVHTVCLLLNFQKIV